MDLNSRLRAYCHDTLLSSIVVPFINWFGVHFRAMPFKTVPELIKETQLMAQVKIHKISSGKFVRFL
jgi:hypothetical protein